MAVHGPLGYVLNKAGQAGSSLLDAMEPYPPNQGPMAAVRALDPRTPQGALTDAGFLLSILMGAKAARAYPGARGEMTDPFDSAARTMSSTAQRNVLIREIERAKSLGGRTTIAGDPITGHLTPGQRAFLAQLKFDPSRHIGQPGFRALTPRQLSGDPSTQLLHHVLGYSVGDPMAELAASQGAAFRSDREVTSKLGQTPDEPPAAIPGVHAGTAEEAYPPLRRTNDRDFPFDNPNLETHLDFVKMIGDILRGGRGN